MKYLQYLRPEFKSTCTYQKPKTLASLDLRHTTTSSTVLTYNFVVQGSEDKQRAKLKGKHPKNYIKEPLKELGRTATIMYHFSNKDFVTAYR